MSIIPHLLIPPKANPETRIEIILVTLTLSESSKREKRFSRERIRGEEERIWMEERIKIQNP